MSLMLSVDAMSVTWCEGACDCSCCDYESECGAERWAGGIWEGGEDMRVPESASLVC